MRKKRIPLYVYLFDLTKAFDPVQKTLRWKVPASFSVPQEMISVIFQFQGGILACVRLDDSEFSDWFPIE